MLTRREFTISAAAAFGGLSGLQACSSESGETYEQATSSTWRHSAATAADDIALRRELVRYAILAPSSHNTQCWKFAVEDKAITIRPDPARRCPAVDPDDHYVFVTLGCATENLMQAALAHGLVAAPNFDATSELVRVTLAPARSRVPTRQPTSWTSEATASRRLR